MTTDTERAKTPETPLSWRLALGLGVIVVAGVAILGRDLWGPRGQACAGIVCIFAGVAMFSSNLRAVQWRPIALGLALQLFLALLILKWELHGLRSLGIPDGYRPGYELFSAISAAVKKFLEFTDHGAKFVFGVLADRETLDRLFDQRGFVFAFQGLPTIIFVSSFFTVLYYLGVLQFIVRVFARGMVYLMGTSGAETLSATANVFLGQTEAPLIVKPYIAGMTKSELLALMAGGMATISGGMMAVYVALGADAVSILTTSVMAAPCGLYLSKLLLPETETPQTSGKVIISPEQSHRNVIDAASAGASDGLHLALNVAAMLIAFLAFLALIDFCLSSLPTGQHLGTWIADSTFWEGLGKLLGTFVVSLPFGLLAKRCLLPIVLGPGFVEKRSATLVGLVVGYGLFMLLAGVVMPFLPEHLTLQVVFSHLFSPLAYLIGIEDNDVAKVANLLGIKLAGNEFLAYGELTTTYRGLVSERTLMLSTFALTGFANFGSVGIQLGGIGPMAPQRRGDLARLGGRALVIGYLATMMNAAIAAVML